eukprot:5407829-Amphidinium_carterae.1
MTIISGQRRCIFGCPTYTSAYTFESKHRLSLSKFSGAYNRQAFAADCERLGISNEDDVKARANDWETSQELQAFVKTH